MAVYISTVKPTPEMIVRRGEFNLEIIASAVIAGIILYFINKSFVNNFPPYVSIIVGILLTIYLYNYKPFQFIGLTLITDGFYKLLTEYITVNS